ncbi:probable ATP-dependent RNA helicase DDX60 [Oscarella lobularis]|uniref:probable ATP-dependent RNA helicase DDX60 n=1 Tax=Oscarella lobularis TaxID=121494 RepID=UPI00331372C3
MSHVESPSESEDSEWIEESESESGSDSETEIESDPEPLDFDSIYHSFAIHYTDVLRDYEEDQAVLVDGDSLVLEAIMDRSLDWDHGGQFLHLTYLVEKKLSGFQRKATQVRVVFFKFMEVVWSLLPDSSALLARKAIIRHLNRSTRMSVACEFESALSDKWKEYLKEECPCFVVMSDKPLELSSLSKFRSVIENARLPFRSLLLGCQQMEIDCVFFAGMKFRVNRIHAFRCCFSPSLRDEVEQVEKELKRATLSHLQFLPCQRQQNEDRDDFEEFFTANVETFIRAVGGHFRLILFGISAAYTLRNMPRKIDLVQLFVLHAGLIELLPLRDRYQMLFRGHDQFFDMDKETSMFLTKMHYLLCSGESLVAAHDLSFPHCEKHYADLMDGRLFCRLVQLFRKSPAKLSDAIAETCQSSNSTSTRLLVVWNAICSAAALSSSREIPLWPRCLEFKGDDAETKSPFTHLAPAWLRSDFHGKSERRRHNVGITKRPLLLNTSFFSYDAYVGEMKTKLAYEEEWCSVSARSRSPTGAHRYYHDDFHWHSGKYIADGMGALPAVLKSTLSPVRDQTKYKSFLQDYAESLVGGTLLNSHPLLFEGKRQQGAKPKQSAKAKKIIEENQKRKYKVAIDKEEEKLTTLIKMSSSSSAEGQLRELDAFVKKAHPEVQFHARERIFDLCRKELDIEKQRLFWKVRLFMAAHSLVDEHPSLINKKLKREIVKEVKQLGFSANAALIAGKLEGEMTASHSESEACCRFQLLNMGHMMQSDKKLAPDPRVKEFIPDEWQAKVMDFIDRNESVVVSAPTSSGKTFISFYCMEKILRSNPDDVLVYVSPTKALVNQVAATVYAQFAHRKADLPEGKTLCGVFTRDYRLDPMKCQILVTVPEVFDILLLSVVAQKWVQRVKYDILDEVHCLGDEGRGMVWERLLLLVPCPFLALSATIGNPDRFRRWTETVQRAKSDKSTAKASKVHLVIHKSSDRFSYLQKYIVVPDQSKSFRTDVVAIHPASAISTNRMINFGFPEDFTMSAAETLHLYDEMSKQFPHNASLAANNPEAFFRGERIIRRNGAKEYETKVKTFVEELSKDPDKSKVEALWNSLQPTSNERLALDKNSSFRKLVGGITDLLLKLNEEEKLPVIVFCLERKRCETLVQTVVEDLFCMEEESTPSLAQRHKDEKRRLKEEKKKRKREEKQNRLLKGKKKRSPQWDDEKEESASEPVMSEYDPRRCRKEYSFYNMNKIRTSEDLAKLERKYLKYSRNAWFKEGLQRGIGCHHSGMAKKERQLTEKLFREGAIKVVVATSTLALGIHMPCRTVVFAGDSPFLNSLGFRQMSGRAGRRGFDPVGNIVFFGVPWKKICQLMTTGVPSLHSSGSLDFSTILRLVMYESGSPFSEEAQRKTLSVLNNAMAVYENADLAPLQRHFYLLAIEYLRRKGLMSPSGHPIGLAGLVTHQFYVDPNNFVAVSFLERGLFHRIVEANWRSRKLSDDTLRRMVHVLAYLFGLHQVHPKVKQRHDRHNRGKGGSPSQIILPPLDEDIQKIIDKHNNEVTEIATYYIKSVVPFEDTKLTRSALPLSKIDFSNDSIAENTEWNSLLSNFRRQAGNDDNRLWFSALSGDKRGVNDFYYVEEFFDIMSNGLPILETKNNVTYSSYVLDFFKHGQVKALEKWSGMTSGEVFRGLQDFYYCTKALSISLEQYEKQNEFIDLFQAFDQVAAAFGAKYSKAYKLLL